MLACAAKTPVLSGNMAGLCGSQAFSGHYAGHGHNNKTGPSHSYAMRKLFMLSVIRIVRAVAVYCVVCRPVPRRFVKAAAAIYIYQATFRVNVFVIRSSGRVRNHVVALDAVVGRDEGTVLVPCSP